MLVGTYQKRYGDHVDVEVEVDVDVDEDDEPHMSHF